jgi:hypothetical protein
METVEDAAELIKSVFEDIEHYQINKILYCKECDNIEKLETLEEALDRLKLIVEEIENSI